MKKSLMKKSMVFGLFVIIIIIVMGTLFVNNLFAGTWNISGSTFSHDPSIIKASNGWWQFYTADGIGLKSSTDGYSWKQCKSIFPANLSWWKNYVPDKTDRNIWAPDIFYYNNRYWVYYSVSTFGSNRSAIGLASCDDIKDGQSWRDDGLVLNSTTSINYNCIDPCLIQDAEGKLWMSFGSFWSGIKLVEINKSTMKPYDNPQIYSIANSSEIEASYIVYNNGYYYLFVSFGKCCQGTNSTYRIAYGRSKNITGPYVDKSNKDMSNGGGTVIDQSSGQWVGPGGQSIARNGSNYLMVCHAYDANKSGEATLRIKDLYFDSSAWPTYTNSVSSTTSQTTINQTTSSKTTVNPTTTTIKTTTSQMTPVPENKEAKVDYSITNDWGGGATIAITITNNSASSINNWVLKWNFSGNQKIINMWCGKYSQTGSLVEVRGESWNSNLIPGGSINIGFNITYTGSNVKPSDIALDIG